MLYLQKLALQSFTYCKYRHVLLFQLQRVVPILRCKIFLNMFCVLKPSGFVFRARNYL